MIMIDGSNRQPIHLLRRNGSIREISSQSLVISSITGINREDYKLYYPKEMILILRIHKLRVLLLIYLMN